MLDKLEPAADTYCGGPFIFIAGIRRLKEGNAAVTAQHLQRRIIHSIRRTQWLDSTDLE
jgi:hypothetical protein